MSGALEFEVFTLFPAAIRAFVDAGLLGKALTRGHLRVHCTDYREFCFDRHRSVDDAPFGGGAGMVLRAEPVIAALESAVAARGPMHRILLTPSGTPFDQRVAERLATLPRIGLICGRYEGIDDRVREGWVDECLSIGDFVLNGGEVAAAAIIEAVARLREGVLGNPESIEHESFARIGADHGWDPGLVVEHPHYTRPATLSAATELDVPELLLRGNHAEVEAWRRRMACLRTWLVRPELRRPWTLKAEHPVILIAPSEAADLLARAGEIARELGLNCTSLQVGADAGRRGMRDLKQALRELRKSHQQPAWVIGVAAAPPEALERHPAMVLDILAFEQRRLPGPLVVWLGSTEHPEHARIQAWLALSAGGTEAEHVSRDELSRLAIARRLIDISQPLSAGSPSLPHVRVALERLRTIIDSSTGSGGPETSS